MADPLTIFGAVVGGIQAAEKVCELIGLLRRVADAPREILSVQEELTAIKTILQSLRPFVLKNGCDLPNDASSIRVDHLRLVATDLTKSMSHLHGIMTLMTNGKGFKASSIVKSALWVKNEKTVKHEINRLQCQKITLVTMLALLEEARRDEATHVIRENRYQIEQLRSELHESRARMGELSPETVEATKDYNQSRRGTPSVVTVNSQNTVKLNLASSVPNFSWKRQYDSIRGLDAFSTHQRPFSNMPENDEDIQQILSSSAPYRRAAKNRGRFSMDSCNSISVGVPLTWFSEFSLSEVSNVSVLLLPLVARDLSTRECYVEIRHELPRELETNEHKPVSYFPTSLGLVRSQDDFFASLNCERYHVVIHLKGEFQNLPYLLRNLEGFVPTCIAFCYAALKAKAGNSRVLDAEAGFDLRMAMLCEHIQRDVRGFLETGVWHIAFEVYDHHVLLSRQQGIASMVKAILSAMPKALIYGGDYEFLRIWEEYEASKSPTLPAAARLGIYVQLLGRMDKETVIIILLCLGILSELAWETEDPEEEMLKIVKMLRPTMLFNRNLIAESAGFLEQYDRATKFLLFHLSEFIEVPDYILPIL